MDQQDIPDLICVDGPQRSLPVRMVLFVLAVLSFVVGIVVWLIPVIGGSFFLYAAGFLLLGMSSRRAARWINAKERALPLKWRLRLRPKYRKGESA